MTFKAKKKTHCINGFITNIDAINMMIVLRTGVNGITLLQVYIFYLQ